MQISPIIHHTWVAEPVTVKRMAEGVFDDDDYILNPVHQRNFVATKSWKADIIKSMITTNVIPETFWYKKKDGKYVCLDGKQRISAILEFCYKDQYEEKFGPADNIKFNNKPFVQLSRELQKHCTKFLLTIRVSQDTLTESETADIFEKFQQSKPTTLGELLHSKTTDNTSMHISHQILERTTFKNIWNQLHGYEHVVVELLNGDIDNPHRNYVGNTNRYEHWKFLLECLYFWRQPGTYSSLSKHQLNRFLQTTNDMSNDQFDKLVELIGTVAIALCFGKSNHRFQKNLFRKSVFLPFFIWYLNNTNSNKNVFLENENNKNMIYEIWQKEKLGTIKERFQVISNIWDAENLDANKNRSHVIKNVNGYIGIDKQII
jgi:hypothetical protein